MDMYSISVLIPFYKAERYFEQCMASVMNQTYPPAEIIIVNDGSGGSAETFLDAYRDVARIIHLPVNRGVAYCRNVLVKEARFPWLAFQDADDIWEVDKLAQQVSRLRLNPTWVGCHGGILTFNEQQVLQHYLNKPSPLRVQDLLMGSHVTPTTLLIRKDCVEQLGGFDPAFRTSSDYEFSVRLTCAGYQLGFVDTVLARMRRENHSNVSSNGWRTFINHVRLVKKHNKVFLHWRNLNKTRCFLALSLQQSGGKIGGTQGALLYYLGRVLGI